MNAVAHEINATLQQYPEARTLAGDSFYYLKERCKELADRIDELLQQFSVIEREFFAACPTKRQSS